jgi:O-antigen/teichoic acid export membrane protein
VYPRAIELRASKQSEKKLLGGAILLSGSVQTVMAILLTLLASPLVNWLAGPSHHIAIEVVRPLSIAYIPLGIAIVVSQFTLALGTLRQSLTFMSITFGVAAILLNVQTDALRFVEALVGFSVILCIILILMALFSIGKIENESAQD